MLDGAISLLFAVELWQANKQTIWWVNGTSACHITSIYKGPSCCSRWSNFTFFRLGKVVSCFDTPAYHIISHYITMNIEIDSYWLLCRAQRNRVLQDLFFGYWTWVLGRNRVEFFFFLLFFWCLATAYPKEHPSCVCIFINSRRGVLCFVVYIQLFCVLPRQKKGKQV